MIGEGKIKKQGIDEMSLERKKGGRNGIRNMGKDVPRNLLDLA